MNIIVNQQTPFRHASLHINDSPGNIYRTSTDNYFMLVSEDDFDKGIHRKFFVNLSAGAVIVKIPDDWMLQRVGCNTMVLQ